MRDRRIAILTGDEAAIDQAMLFSQLSDQVTVVLNEASDPRYEQWEQLAALGVKAVHPRVERLVMDGAEVRGIEIDGGRIFEVDGVVVAPKLHARTGFCESLCGVVAPTPFGAQIPLDPNGLTKVPGVWAAGDASQPASQWRW